MLRDNLEMTVNVLDAVRDEAPEAVVVCLELRRGVRAADRLPITEDAPLRPQNPYAVSKAACDLLAGQYADAHGLHDRPREGVQPSGPGAIGRVRDRHDRPAGGGGRGRGRWRDRHSHGQPRLGPRLHRRARQRTRLRGGEHAAGGGLQRVQRHGDQRARAGRDGGPRGARRGPPRGGRRAGTRHDVPEVRGSAERLAEASGWRPEIPLEQTIADAIAYWRERR